MKKIILPFLFLTSTLIYSQGYFDGKDLNCPTNNQEANRLFEIGIKMLHINTSQDPKNLAINADVFAKAVQQDTSFCDAYFFTGYLLNLSKDYRNAYAFLKVADSFSLKPSLIYKQNLAALCMKVGMFEEARESYREITLNFPASPEGYYGIAATSPMIGDYKYGLENIMKAENIYIGIDAKIQCLYIKGILFTLNGQYLEAKNTLEPITGKYKNDLNFKIYYSLALLKLSAINDDDKMKRKARKIYRQIDENYIPPDLQSEFKF